MTFDDIEGAYDALMATYRRDAQGRFVVDLNDAGAIARRRELRAFLEPHWPVVSEIRTRRAKQGRCA